MNDETMTANHQRLDGPGTSECQCRTSGDSAPAGFAGAGSKLSELIGVVLLDILRRILEGRIVCGKRQERIRPGMERAGGFDSGKASSITMVM